MYSNLLLVIPIAAQQHICHMAICNVILLVRGILQASPALKGEEVFLPGILEHVSYLKETTYW